MNKKLLAAALGVVFAAPAFADSSNLTIYGRIHQNLVHNSEDTTGSPAEGGNFTLQNVSSRLGFRGEEDLGGGLKALFGYEFGVNSDNSNGGTNSGLGSARHTYLGLAGSWGKVTAGTQDGGNASVAPLYNQASMIGSVSNNGGALTTVSGTINSGTNVIAASQRKNNSFAYETKSGDWHVTARHSLGGTNNVNNGATKENDNRETELAITYKAGALTVGGGYSSIDFQTSTTPTAGSTQVEDLIQLVATYQLGSLKLGGVVNQRGYFVNQANGEDSDTNFALTGLYKLSGNTGIFGMIADGENNGAVAAGNDIQQLQLSAYYDFSKRTRTYVGFERVNVEAKNNSTETDTDSFVIGLRHNF